MEASMFRIAKNAAAALALTGLVLSQPALAGSSTSNAPASRNSSPAGSSEGLAGTSTIGLLLGLLVVAGFVAILADDNGKADHPASP
jgi:hypothetical protein